MDTVNIYQKMFEEYREAYDCKKEKLKGYSEEMDSVLNYGMHLSMLNDIALGIRGIMNYMAPKKPSVRYTNPSIESEHR